MSLDKIEKYIKRKVYNELNKPDNYYELEKDKDTFVILVRGKRIITRSGKSVWSSIGAAKNAFNNHLDSATKISRLYWDIDDKFEDSDIVFNSYEIAIKYKKEWISENVSFITMKDYLKMMGRSR